MTPRGLKNPGKLSLVNATLQALLSCTPFVQVVCELEKCHIQRHPTLHAFSSLITKVDIPFHQSNGRREPFSAVIIFKGIIRKYLAGLPQRPSDGMKNIDAQEFLAFMINEMHQELLKLRGSSSVQDNWETIQRTSISPAIWKKKFVPSELSDIFWGQQRTIVEPNEPFLEIFQPFLVLHLNISPSSVHTIEDSLRLHFGTKNSEGCRSSKNYVDKNSADKSTKIEKLPRILILHLMRFSFENSGFVKFDKPVKFSSYLEMENDLLASPTQHQRIFYELVASVTHHGSKSSTGHYTADIKYPEGPWMRCDDEKVAPVSSSDVFHDQAYILLYVRLCCCDCTS
ncbi:Ubiquitinyl hydrolase 1 protein [Dioscorea alata]|uniref:Ubiquitinyl hydrolase 1 protein n=1 Tax=Dioscorea alata TaxID=55571 RepID=A0ACB7VWT2_DIOAL|nr:Ubiquitinyl hydrolase 1 protein [Dioscorea alata]